MNVLDITACKLCENNCIYLILPSPAPSLSSAIPVCPASIPSRPPRFPLHAFPSSLPLLSFPSCRIDLDELTRKVASKFSSVATVRQTVRTTPRTRAPTYSPTNTMRPTPASTSATCQLAVGKGCTCKSNVGTPALSAIEVYLECSGLALHSLSTLHLI